MKIVIQEAVLKPNSHISNLGFQTPVSFAHGRKAECKFNSVEVQAVVTYANEGEIARSDGENETAVRCRILFIPDKKVVATTAAFFKQNDMTAFHDRIIDVFVGWNTTEPFKGMLNKPEFHVDGVGNAKLKFPPMTFVSFSDKVILENLNFPTSQEGMPKNGLRLIKGKKLPRILPTLPAIFKQKVVTILNDTFEPLELQSLEPRSDFVFPPDFKLESKLTMGSGNVGLYFVNPGDVVLQPNGDYPMVIDMNESPTELVQQMRNEVRTIENYGFNCVLDLAIPFGSPFEVHNQVVDMIREQVNILLEFHNHPSDFYTIRPIEEKKKTILGFEINQLPHYQDRSVLALCLGGDDLRPSKTFPTPVSCFVPRTDGRVIKRPGESVQVKCPQGLFPKVQLKEPFLLCMESDGYLGRNEHDTLAPIYVEQEEERCDETSLMSELYSTMNNIVARVRETGSTGLPVTFTLNEPVEYLQVGLYKMDGLPLDVNFKVVVRYTILVEFV